MSGGPGDTHGVAYEISVRGHLGPMLRHALGQRSVAPGAEVVVRAVLPPGRDLVDLLGLLEQLHLEVTEVSQVA